MSLLQTYEAFLKAPLLTNLRDDATLHYVPTLTSFRGASAINKHLTSQSKELNQRENTQISCIIGQKAICLETETKIEFLSGGGAYLPGVEDNFVADEIVVFPLTHIVEFDGNGIIAQIRLSWDQGSLLKQIGIIGARAKSWPIRDGVDQALLIKSQALEFGKNSSIAHEAGSKSINSEATSHTEDTLPGRIASHDLTSDKFHSRNAHDHLETVRPSAIRATNATNEHRSTIVKPKSQAAKPAQHQYHDLFVGDDDEATSHLNNGQTLRQENVPIAPKFGAGKNFKPSRLFDFGEDEPAPRSPSKATTTKPSAQKYSHFEFGDGDDVPKNKAIPARTKHQSQWTFEDFATPQKPVHHGVGIAKPGAKFAWEENEDLPPPSPTRRPVQATNSGSVATMGIDDGGSLTNKDKHQTTALGGSRVRAAGLFEDHGSSDTDSREKVSSTNTNLKDRSKDFDAHFEISDDSPRQSSDNRVLTSEAQKRVVSQMGSSWTAYEQSPASSTADHDSSQRGIRAFKNEGIKSDGDGMGGRKGVSRGWQIGEDDRLP